MEQMYQTLGEFTPDNLIAGHEIPVIVKGIVLAKDQGIIRRGTVIGIETATQLAKPVDTTKTDGTQTPFGITTDTIDTSGTADVKTTVYISGLFNSNALVFGGTDTITDHEMKLRELGIFVKENIPY